MSKNFTCPFCLQKFSSRYFLLNIHTHDCLTREKYFNKKLPDAEMEVIQNRVNGETYKTEVVNYKNFNGKALEKEFDP